ncbi:polyprenyl synthetase family protein [Rhodococcus sp. HNM0569]|uniref:polyprenyl synthetase family protein n=1 Tax=Rhodococcus sp. HNM0569 TaxID=2716340 RepID=UPI00146C21A7|nr:polyprenyl synthetase family protein [Rhodococcus sp. HNM0569]NLU82905.1 polyprenyl synthetase family protein [Rhodococcus sp. HNM0569]
MSGQVESALGEFFRSRADEARAIGGAFPDAVALLEDYVFRGGKRLRPHFAWIAWQGAGGDPDGPDAPAVLRALSALELVQACALVHDDIIDASTTRRGFPTVHVEFAQRHRREGWRGDGTRFGESAAILLGDLALAWADDMFHGSGVPPEAAGRVAPVWSAMRTEMLGGQFLDITTEATADESVDAALRIDRFKTAAYTVERPLHLGAVLAGADDALVAAYRSIGADLGVAYQLRDDLLGVFGDPQVTGKPSGDDLRSGKRTVLLATALDHGDRTDAAASAELRAGIGTDLSVADVERLRVVIRELGAVADVEDRIDALTARASRTLDACTATDDAKRDLAALAESLTQRTS